jgi:hypothetical protein
MMLVWQFLSAARSSALGTVTPRSGGQDPKNIPSSPAKIRTDNIAIHCNLRAFFSGLILCSIAYPPVNMAEVAASSAKSKSPAAIKPEKPDEEQYKKDVDIAQKELDKSQERLVHPSAYIFCFVLQDSSVADDQSECRKSQSRRRSQ